MCVPPQHLIPLIVDQVSQQTIANADQIREIEQRVRSLCGVLTYPVGDKDHEEKVRREALRRFVPPFQRYWYIIGSR